MYTYGSFLQSRMHARGVTCSDCHDPHSGKLRAPGNAADRAEVSAMTTRFRNNQYRLKQVFAEAAVYCMGD